jgi:hypothetical protein
MSAPAVSRTDYRVRLDQIECCSCPPGCNCQFAGIPNNGYCEFLIGFRVREGHFGPVKLDGATFALAIRYPGAIHEGNGHVALFVDQKASPAQVDAIAGILSGQHGGMPWEALAATVTRFEGPIRAPIELKVDGTRSSFRVPGVLEVRQTPIKDIVSGAEKEVQIRYPQGGFFWNTGNICTTAVMQVHHGDLQFEHPGGYACHAEANWSNAG